MSDDIDTAVIERGEKAKAELAMTAVVCAGIRQAALEEIVITNPEHTRKLDRLILTAQIIDAIRMGLQKAVDAGTVENYRNLLAENTEVLRP